MIFLPIVGRELRVAARRRATHWTRMTVVLGAVATCVCFYVGNVDEPPHTQAHRVFTGLMVISLIYSLAADLGFGFAAWHQLRTRFRGLASQRFMSVMETKPQPRKGINHGCPAPLSTGLSGPEIFFREKTGNGAVLALQVDSSILFIGLGSF